MADLFMECEEEELEPWQQIHSNMADDALGNAERNASAGQANYVSSAPASSEPKAVVIPNLQSVVKTASTVPLLTNTLSPTVVTGALSAAVPADISQAVHGQQVILAQGGGALGAVALSQVLLPGASPITNAPGGQPFYFATQGLPVQNIQPGQSPVGLVLNVQQGQTVRPITLVQAPGTQIFKPAVGAPQIITQPVQMRPTAPAVNRAPVPNAFNTVQIPATLTIRTTTAVSQPTAKPVPTMTSTTVTQPTTAIRSPGRTTTKIVTIKPGNGPLDMQNLMSIVKSVTLPGGAQSQTFVLMSNQNANGPSVSSTVVPVSSPAVVQMSSVSSPTNTTPSSSSSSSSPSTYQVCPRCGAQFKMIEALRSHMCFCCPDLAQMTATSGTAPVANTTDTPPKKLCVPPRMKKENPPSKGGEAQSRLVMLVDDFYYGTFEGNRVYVPMDNLKEPLSFRCLTCSKKLRNNIRLMNHMRYHVELEQQNGEMDTHTACQHCFRRFPTPFRLQCHLESVHTAVESSTKCKICEWSFESEPVFLQHMKNTHKPGEMPYVCQVCEYRSSFYSDVYNHFRTWHEDTRHLLCQYCLKVFKHSSSYQQHYVRHQKSTVYHCNKCRLQFLFTKDKVEHKINHHRTFRKPRELEGLRPGTKVTIRAYVEKKNSGQLSSKMPANPQNSKNIISSSPTSTSDHNSPRKGAVKKQVSKTFDFLAKFQEQRALLGRQKCVECTFDIPDFSNHYPTYVHCSLCFYSTCCSRAYANHMINNHVPGRAPKASKRALPSGLKLTCAVCNYATAKGDLMAKHLVRFPEHSSCIFTQRECLETDIEFCHVEEEEVEGPQASDVGTKPDWLSMEHWSVPRDEGTVPEFMDSCGPQHLLSKTSDVLDYFRLLFPDILFDQIVYETNAYARYCLSLGQGDPTWFPLTTEEVKGFFGLCILVGLQNLPEPEMYWSWDHHHGSAGSRTWELLCRSMSFKRFKQISTHIRMSSMLVENDNQNVDKLLFFQPMLSVLQTSMQETYRPNKCLTIDQAFLPSNDKGIVRERSKHSQPKIWLLCDSKSGYCHKLLILTQQEKDKNLGQSVVPHLVEGLEGKHHHIFLSSSLASIPLIQELYEAGIYCSFSIPPRSPILPNEFWDQPTLDNTGDFQQYEYSPLLVTRWKDTKQMVCLSTNAESGQPDTVWRRSSTKPGELCSIKRPLSFKLLQDNMRGVDICSQLLTCNQLGGIVLDTNWRRLFWFLVNLSIINSFIVLRETRKDNPPLWFPGGHFSQAIYRKRLGYQLAKCAERYALLKEIHDKKPLCRQSLNTNKGIRHRLAKITRRTRRCKICNLKNQRHESVFGCTACLVNLCKRSCCFWDYHGFSPNFQGNAKVGFLALKSENWHTAKVKSERSLRSSSVGVSVSRGDVAGLDDDVDLEMAPLEDVDTDIDTDTAESDQQESCKMVNRQQEKPAVETTTNSTLSQPVKDRQENLTVRQLRTLLLALCSGIQRAAKEMDTEPQVIETWLQNKENQLKVSGEGSSRTFGEVVERLVEWVLALREQQRPISEAKLFEKASELQSQSKESGSFRISYEWAVNFMLQHKLGFHAANAVCRKLPESMEENCRRFIGLVHSQIQTNNVQHCVFGAMDQLSIFVDFNMLNDNTNISKEAAFQLTGSGKPFVKIYFSMLADGTVLPAMIFFKSHASKVSISPPDSILLMAKEEGFSESEELEVWAVQVWKRHLDSQKDNNSVLVMDSHHSHMSEDLISKVSSTKTFPAIVPIGCTGRHQPLEMCVRPSLQRLFLARWARQLTDNGASGIQPEELVKHLVAWLEEAMSCFSSRSEFIQHSFCLAHLIPDHTEEQHKDLPGTPLELLNLLSNSVLGTEVLDFESAEEEPMDVCTANKMTEAEETEEIKNPDQSDKGSVQNMGNKMEQQTQDTAGECLEMANQSTDRSHSTPESEASLNTFEKDNSSESCQNLDACQTDSTSSR